MNCEEIRTVIPRYMAGQSDAAEAAAIEEHLTSCRQCTAELEADRQVDANLREAMLEEEPDTSAVIRRVVAHVERKPWWSRVPGVRTVRIATAAALIFMALFAGRAVYVQQVEENLAMSAADDHYRDLVVLKRTDWAYSGASSTAFVQTTFPDTPDLVRSITPAGGSLEKVRICRLKGRPYAHFVFQTPQGEASVFLRAKKPGEYTYTPGDVHDRSNGLEVAGFSSQSFVGAVVGQDGHIPTGAIAAHARGVL